MDHGRQKQHTNHYLRLGLMASLSFVAMYWLMFAMVDSIANVFMSFNQAYMAALMTAPMVATELVVMRTMYQDARLNRILIGASVVIAVAMFLVIREQSVIGDRQFLRSMIPHHAGAILMCQKGSITDPELRTLCQQIITSQQREINQMKAKLGQLQ